MKCDLEYEERPHIPCYLAIPVVRSRRWLRRELAPGRCEEIYSWRTPCIVVVRVAREFLAMTTLDHCTGSVECKELRTGSSLDENPGQRPTVAITISSSLAALVIGAAFPTLVSRLRNWFEDNAISLDEEFQLNLGLPSEILMLLGTIQSPDADTLTLVDESVSIDNPSLSQCCRWPNHEHERYREPPEVPSHWISPR